MKRKLFLAGLPFVILGPVLLPIAYPTPPMITLVSNERLDIPSSYHTYYSVGLSSSQVAEFQFSSNHPMDFYILDQENFDLFLQNQTNFAIVAYMAESQNTHRFKPTETGTYFFMIFNTGAQDATVTVTIRRSFSELGYIGAGILILGGVLVTLGYALKPKATEIPTQVLEMIKMYGRIQISELAARFSTSETDIELTLLKLRNMNEPVFYNAATREVSYGPRLPPPESPSSSAQPAEHGS